MAWHENRLTQHSTWGGSDSTTNRAPKGVAQPGATRGTTTCRRSASVSAPTAPGAPVAVADAAAAAAPVADDVAAGADVAGADATGAALVKAAADAVGASLVPLPLVIHAPLFVVALGVVRSRTAAPAARAAAGAAPEEREGGLRLGSLGLYRAHQWVGLPSANTPLMRWPV